MSLTADTRKHIKQWIKPYFGSDPELFVSVNNKIIGAEKVLPKEGLISGYQGGLTPGSSKIVLDGVQMELHPSPASCRAQMANDFKVIFTKVYEQLKAKKAEASFDSLVNVTKEEMTTLSKEARQLGCAPSLNLHNPNATIKVPKNFRQRSAGGHIHVGLVSNGYSKLAHPGILGDEAIDKQIKILDVVLGTASVLIDRDPSSAIRRKVYGRASEHRKNAHGYEYRVLNNFWLRSYQLMSLVFGLARLSVNIHMTGQLMANRYAAWDAGTELMKRVDYDKVCEAINLNDRKKALKQWEGVESFIDEFVTDTQSGLWTGDPLKYFRHFVDTIDKKGIKYYFPDDPIDHWRNIPEGHTHNADGYAGWETYLMTIIPGDQANTAVDDVLARIMKGAA